jgi:cytochrome P450
MDLILILAAILFVAVLYRSLRHDPNLPPCPTTPLPIVGHLFVLQEDSRAQFKKWRTQVGDVFSVYIGSQLTVVASGYDTIKELLVKKGDDSLGRPDVYLDIATGIPKKGIIMSDGPEWKEQRSVGLQILRNFGMGKNILAEKIQEEALCYLDVLADLKGKPTDIKLITNTSSSNIVCSVMIGQRFEYDDMVFLNLQHSIDAVVADFATSNLATFFPILKYLPGDLFKTKRIHASIRKIMDVFVHKFVRDKSNEKLEDGNPDNFISAYLREWRQRVKSGEETTMDEGHLAKIVWDIFNAGTSTVSTTIIWCVLYCLNYPEVQEKLYAEIEAEVGTERLPSMQDKGKLVYLNAFIMESQRLASIAALSFPRKCTSDVTVNGYTIPKGASIIANMDSVSYDEKIWGDHVYTLKPERFIDENGKLKKTPEEFVPFSIGKRICPGEGWAKMVLFLYLAAMIQRFKFVAVNPASPPPTDYVFGLDVWPKAYEVRFVSRHVDK